MLKQLVCASLIAVSPAAAQGTWVPFMASDDATIYTYPNSSTPRAGCSLCVPEKVERRECVWSHQVAGEYVPGRK